MTSHGRLIAGLTLAAVISAFPLVGCSDEDGQSDAGPARGPSEDEIFGFIDDELPDEALTAATPDGFSVTQLKRNGFERNGEHWVTVGVQMEGPVMYSRAIFYVHPNPAAATEMFEHQTGINRSAATIRRRTHGFSIDELLIPNVCGVRIRDMFWCHAHKGRVYLVIQSSAGGPGRQFVTADERRAARDLLEAFGALLEEEVPAG